MSVPLWSARLCLCFIHVHFGEVTFGLLLSVILKQEITLYKCTRQKSNSGNNSNIEFLVRQPTFCTRCCV